MPTISKQDMLEIQAILVGDGHITERLASARGAMTAVQLREGMIGRSAIRVNLEHYRELVEALDDPAANVREGAENDDVAPEGASGFTMCSFYIVPDPTVAHPLVMFRMDGGDFPTHWLYYKD